MRCCQQCVRALRAKPSHEKGKTFDETCKAISCRTSSKLLTRTFTELFETNETLCPYCWGLFQNSAEHLWSTIRTQLKDQVPQIFENEQNVNIGIGLPPDLRDFHKLFGSPSDAEWNESIRSFLGIESDGAAIPSLNCILKNCCQVILRSDENSDLEDVVDRAASFAPTLVDSSTDFDFELEVFLETSEKSFADPLMLRPSKKRRVSRHKKSSSLAFPSFNQNWEISIDWRSPPLVYSGAYVKLTRDICQSPWSVNGQNLAESRPTTSIHEIIGAELKKVHASADENLIGNGREDTDVRMLGGGRDFLVQVKKPRLWRDVASPVEIQARINEVAKGRLVISNLQLVGRGQAKMANLTKTFHQTGETKQKVYGFVMATSRPVPLGIDDEINRLMSERATSEVATSPIFSLKQKTPLRVLHRRAAMSRNKGVYDLTIKQLTDRIFCCKMLAAGGTYIKEFVHGDFGRTEPDLASLIMRAEQLLIGSCDTAAPVFCDLLQLDVLNLKSLPVTCADDDDVASIARIPSTDS